MHLTEYFKLKDELISSIKSLGSWKFLNMSILHSMITGAARLLLKNSLPPLNAFSSDPSISILMLENPWESFLNLANESIVVVMAFSAWLTAFDLFHSEYIDVAPWLPLGLYSWIASPSTSLTANFNTDAVDWGLRERLRIKLFAIVLDASIPIASIPVWDWGRKVAPIFAPISRKAPLLWQYLEKKMLRSIGAKSKNPLT